MTMTAALRPRPLLPHGSYPYDPGCSLKLFGGFRTPANDLGP